MIRIRVFGELAVEIDGAPWRGSPAAARGRCSGGWPASRRPSAQSRRLGVLAGRAGGEAREPADRAGRLRRSLGNRQRPASPRAAPPWASRTVPTFGSTRGSSIGCSPRGTGDQALAVCRGELLSDLDDDWVLEERQAHRERMATLLGALGAAAEQAGDLDRAVGYARERLALDPLSEDARASSSDGSRAPAIARAPPPCIEGFARAFGELGLAPSPETRALVEKILNEPESPVVRSPPSRRRH